MCGDIQTGQVLKLAHPLLCTACGAHGGTAFTSSADFYAGATRVGLLVLEAARSCVNADPYACTISGMCPV